VTTYQTMADPTAVMGRRIGAYIVDAIVSIAIIIAIFAATIDTESTGGFNPCPDDFDSSSEQDFQFCDLTAPNGDTYFVWWDGDDGTAFKVADTYVLWAVYLGFSFLVAVVWQGLSGMTVGKALFGIRTVNEAGQAPGIGKAIVRWVLLIVDGIGCCVPLVGPIVAFTSKGHRRVGDMAAKTFVVDKNAMGTPLNIPGVTATPAYGVPSYGAPQAGWGTTPPMTPPSSPVAAPPTAGEPQWDPARNAYIQWDAAQQKWLQFDDATQQWRPID
jgi:uncharacterized RDD family membrane protein YckC